ncbi:MAG: sugar phosphate nucleotidyltransferase [Patescibacteria group bacterium]|nr:sugar phosphate nucleotidyltransferase [Patescibacteria group bacterium]
MRKIKNIILLAAGDGDRFWPLENKVLFSFLGVPLIIHLIQKLINYGEKIYLVAHENNASFIKRLVDNYNLSSVVDISIQKSSFPGQAGAIDTLKKFVNGEVLIVNANDKIDFSILQKVTQFSYEENKVIFFGKKTNEYFPGGYFKFDKNNKLEAVIEKPKKEEVPSDIIKLVLDYYSDFSLIVKAINEIKSNFDNIYEQAVNKVLNNSSLKRNYFIYQEEMISLKYSWNVLTMMKSFLEEIKKPFISKSAKVSKKSKIIGNVFIDEESIIGDYVKILGPVYIGKNSIIGDYSLVRESHIGEDCLIGSYNEVARSYIGNKVFLHRNYIGDSVLDNNVMVGAGANTANLRFDAETVKSYINDEKIDTNFYKLGAIIGKNSKIGVGATIFPGVKIGKNTWVAPREIVRYDLEDYTYLINGEEKNNTKS